MSTHTPGPWTIRQTSNSKNGTEWRDILGPGEFGPMYIGEALESNAHLIAASPDLLCACMAALDVLDTHDIGQYGITPLLRSAIAKAKGIA